MKIHDCERCGCSFGLTVTVRGSLRTSSAKGIQRATKRAVERARGKAVEPFLCPACGHLQESMVAAKRHRLSRGITLFLSAAAFFLLLWRSEDANAGGLLPWLASLLLAAGGLAMQYRVLRMKVVPIGQGRPLSDPSEATNPEAEASSDSESLGIWWLPLACMALAALLFASTRVWSPAQDGAHNPDWTPVYLGPGERGKVSLSESITSVDGRWYGQGTATLSGFPDDYAGKREVRASGGKGDWSAEIRAKSAKEAEVNLYARLRIPDDPTLAGRTLGISITMDISYPVSAGEATFVDRTHPIQFETAVKLSKPGQNAAVVSHWNTVTLVSLAFLLIGTWWITIGLDRRRRGPGTFFPQAMP